MKPAALTLRASHFMPRSLLRLRHPHRIRYSLTPPLGPQRNTLDDFCAGPLFLTCNALGQTAVMPGHLVEYNSSIAGRGVATSPRSE